MDRIIVMETDFTSIQIVDTWKSLIWVDRFWEYGDFELYLAATPENLQLFIDGRYVYSLESENIMIIEGVLVETSVEEGRMMTVTGRSLASILERRIIWNQTTFTGPLWQGIQKYLNENAIAPTDASRVIPNLIFETPTDPKVLEKTLDVQITGANLYETIQVLCETNQIGFKMRLNDQNQFVFSLYAGTDRSYEQTDNPYVVFSPDFDNLISTNSLHSRKTEKNVILVAGEGEGLARRRVAVGNASGLDRREYYQDARDISSNDGAIGTAAYNALLIARGEETMADNKATESFECQVDPNRSFMYNVDYFLGDIMSIFDGYGDVVDDNRFRMLELVMTRDVLGNTSIPTFAIVEDD